MSYLLKIILAIIFAIKLVYTIDYCQLDCKINDEFVKHTICERNNSCGPHSDCIEMRMNDTFREWVVDIHNLYRNRVAVGNETRMNLTSAADMNYLIYDRELEEIAKCHINRCQYSHDKCRRTEKYPDVGQNVYTYISGTTLNKYSDFRKSIRKWYNLIDLIEPQIIDSFETIIGRKIEDFTQIIWARTVYIGCAISQSKGKKEIYFACNYGPGGNVYAEPVYQRGEPCSACPLYSVCDEKYTGLCRLLPNKTEESVRARKVKSSSQSNYLSQMIIVIITVFIISNAIY